MVKLIINFIKIYGMKGLCVYVLICLQSLSIKAVNLDVVYLDSIQTSIENACSVSLQRKDTRLFDKIKRELNKNRQTKIIQYWIGYESLYESNYFTTINEIQKAKSCLDFGIDKINGIQNKDSESYALLAYLQCCSIRFTKGIEAGIMSKKSVNSAKKALELDSMNIRGWLVLGIIDYFTPKQFGGLENSEKYLKKAISLPSQKMFNKYLPSWGKLDAYVLLVDFYIKSGNKASAKLYYDIATKEFPGSKKLL